jgi:hypothetical protein
MYRTILGLVIVSGIILYVHHQFHNVMRQVTTKSKPAFLTTSTPQESRRKCVMCGGTGRAPSFTLVNSNSTPSKPCPSCHGTGWVDNPLFGQ